MAIADIWASIQNNNMVKILIVLVAVYFIYTYIQPQEGFIMPEQLENVMAQGPVEDVFTSSVSGQQPEQAQQPVAEVKQETGVPVQGPVIPESAGLSAEDLLPKYDDANEFAKENPVSKLLQEQNFLISGYHTGINTVMQSNKIPYLDIRSLPPVAKEDVGPWNQSSFEQSPGQKRRFFEIGA